MLAEKAVWFLGHTKELKAYGERGRAAVLKNKGAGEKHASVIMRLSVEGNTVAENEKEGMRDYIYGSKNHKGYVKGPGTKN